MFRLSGAINVLLFLIIRPELLLFPRPEELDVQEIQLTPAAQGTGPASFSDTAKFQHSPALGDEGSKDSATPSHINLRRISDDI